VISLLQFNLFFPGLQLLIEVGDARDTSAINISLRNPQVRIALKTDPVISRVPPNPLIKKYPLHSYSSPSPNPLPDGGRVTVRDNFVLIAFINYHTITQNRTQWRELN
jgi:hypothetical protein